MVARLREIQRSIEGHEMMLMLLESLNQRSGGGRSPAGPPPPGRPAEVPSLGKGAPSAGRPGGSEGSL